MARVLESRELLGHDQAGVSVVEVVVAMFILAVMSVAVLPLMIGAVQASTANRDVVAASSLANAQLAELQDTYSNSKTNSCAAVRTRAAELSLSAPTAPITVGACPSPSDYPGTVTVTVQAFRPNSATAVVTLNSAILVTTS